MDLSQYAQTTLAAAQAATTAHISDQVNAMNVALKADYLTAFNNWLTNWNAARIADKSSAPKPPQSWVVAFFNDPTTGPGSVGPYGDQYVQWAYPSQAGPAICDQPPIPDVPAPQVQAVLTGSDDRMNVAPGDTVPVGSTIRAVDGSVWRKSSSPTPFGIAYYYERIKVA